MALPQSGNFYSSLVANCFFNAFLSYTAIMLNIITKHALRKTSSLPKPLKTLLLSLAVSDLGVGLLVQPLYIATLIIKMEQSNKHDPDLKFIDTAQFPVIIFPIFASFLSVVALTIDRFLVIHLHLRYQELVTRKRVFAVVILIWVISASYSLFFSKWMAKKSGSIIFATTVDAVCCITTGFLYCKIYAAVRRHRNQIQAQQVQQVTAANDEMTNDARLRKTAAATFYIYLVFLTCYFPFTCFNVAGLISGSTTFIQTLKVYGYTLMFLNSSLNPLIYCWKMRHIRRAVMDILRNIYTWSKSQLT